METEVAETAPRFSDLPMEVLEIVYSSLLVRDRVRLSCTCRTQWRHVASSTNAWATVEVAAITRERVQALLPWLARRQQGLRRLQLEFTWAALESSDGQPQTQLAACLGGSPLVQLKLFRTSSRAQDEPRSCAAAELQWLGSCTALTSLILTNCGLGCLPGTLELLPALAELSLAKNEYQLAQASWGQLRQLTALTRLDISSCGLLSLPAELTALTGLADLSLFHNYLIERDSWGPLQHLTALTRLDIGACGLVSLLVELAVLPALADLSLAENKELGGADWAPLQQLTALTRLDISNCGLAALPAELAALPALAALDLYWNRKLGAAAEEAWAPLAQCSSLTWLRLQSIPFPRLPAALAPLAPCLVDLNLVATPYSSRSGLWASGEAALGPLLRLTGLTRLALYNCTRELGISLPEELSRLVALQDLKVSCRDSESPGEMLRPLWHLTALTHLHLDYWGLHEVPEEISHLQALKGLGLRINLRECEDMGWQPLARLTALTKLEMMSCHVKRLPPVLAELRSLAELDLGGNYHLVRGESAACIAANWAALEHLTALTRLDARNCDMDAVPAVFAALPGLRVLKLQGNRLLGSAGVEALRPLTRMNALEDLDLRDCYLPRELEMHAIPFPLHRLEGWAERLLEDIARARWRSGPL